MLCLFQLYYIVLLFFFREMKSKTDLPNDNIDFDFDFDFSVFFFNPSDWLRANQSDQKINNQKQMVFRRRSWLDQPSEASLINSNSSTERALARGIRPPILTSPPILASAKTGLHRSKYGTRANNLTNFYSVSVGGL